MGILENFFKNILKTAPGSYTIGIGLGESSTSTKNIWTSVEKICRETTQNVAIIGPEGMISSLPHLIEAPDNLDYIISNNPSQTLLYLLFKKKSFISQKNKEIRALNAIIRGGLSSAKFIKELKELVHDELKRLALLETADSHQFYFAPVGIDEATSYNQRKDFLIETIKFFQRLHEQPKIGVLSAGRLGDLGRSPKIDQNIRETKTLIDDIQNIYPTVAVNHSQILIEQAINEGMDVILAPDGISGNLIYRTLVHLGAGKSYGAIYLGCFNNLSKIIVDTSRVAPENEYYGALVLGLGLSVLGEK